MSRKFETDILVRGELAVHSIPAQGTVAAKFLTLDSASAIVSYRTAAQLLSDIGAASASITLEDVLLNGNITMQSMTVGGLAVNGAFALPTLSEGVLKVDANGNVYSDATQLVDITDYDYDLIGPKDGVNQIFTTRYNFVLDTTRVFINGIRLTLGAGYDYDEVAPNQIQIFDPPVSGDLITVDYKITIP